MTRFTLALLISFFTASAAYAAESIGTITQATGWAYRVTDEDKTRLKKDDAVYTNDVIATENESSLSITFADQSVLRLGNNTEMVLDRFVYDADKDSVETVINIGKGFFRYTGGAVSEKQADIKTPVATLGIRGTRFFGKVEEEGGKTMIALEECCVEMRSDAGAVMLKEPQTYSEISSKDSMPTTPVACDITWINDVSQSLGLPTDSLGYHH